MLSCALRTTPLLALSPILAACERTGSTEQARPAAPAPLVAPTAVAAPPVTGAPPEPTLTDTPAPLAAPTARAGPLKLVYGMDGYSALNLVPIVAAEKPELMLQQRLALEVVVTGNSTASVQALLGGSVSLAGAATEAAWSAQTTSQDLKQIAAVANGTPYSLVAGPDFKQVSDLKRKPIGVTAASGGIDTTAARLILSENGLKSGEYLLISLGPRSDRAAALHAGTVAAVVSLEPDVSRLSEAGFAILDVGDDHPRLRDLQPAVVLSRKSWYDRSMCAALAYPRGGPSSRRSGCTIQATVTSCSRSSREP
ncbi:MAG: ABC transporter substrate-binding protein [Chloroflexi bacterium]|nr:ABC transporter substrate-binding protein [Chloroflexota bacterium]